ncbi:DUF2877 domain-containing protein [Pedococcus sp. NPDC057267]|uniref:oxamate carbamoyltransferase subunit AllH family protein n=1 Tax=Pedococcus sp. NPDC057267 TaxID=3346077 RepID=UPI00363C9756
MSLPATAWPAAASCRSPLVLDRPARPASVLAAFPAALYLDVDGSLLPVVTPDGLRLPTALVLGGGLQASGWGVRPGDAVEVGSGRVRLPGADVVAVRTWQPRAVLPAPGPVRVPAGVDRGSAAWRPAAAALAELLLDGQDPAPAVGALVGAGPGLTPSGDDVLCGVLLGLRLAARLDAVATLGAAVRGRLGGTTTLSAALLTEAVAGYAVPQVLRLASALARGDDRAAVAAAREVAAVGHSSGRDLLAGVVGALEACTPEVSALEACTTALREAS